MAHAAGPLTLDEAERAVEEQLSAKSGVFGGFYRPFLKEGADVLSEWGRTWTGEQADAVDFSRLAGSVLDSVLAGQSGIGVRTLITAFHSARAQEAPAPTYEEFHARISTEEGRQNLEEAFPELPRLLRLVTRQRLTQTREVLQAAVQDREVLAERFRTGGGVVSITAGLGDSHRQGRTVCFVTWANGVTLVYKPQARSTVALLESLRGIVDADDTFFGPLYPDTAEGAHHLWQRPVRYSDLADADEASTYFRRFGRCAALFAMLGTGDLHHENVVATRQGPVVIDLETLVSLPTPTAAQTGFELAADIEVSVLSTLLFPARYPGEVIDVDMSALGSERTAPSQRLNTFEVVDAGTDDIRFDTRPVTIPPGTSIARLEGAQLDPREWTEVIAEGFREGHERLVAANEQVTEVVRESRGWVVRQILRPSFVYSRFLEASTHPAYLSSRADRIALFDRLLPRRCRGLKQAVVEETCAQEAAAMADLDIPFFEVECDSRALLCNGGQERVPGAVVASPLESALERIETFRQRPAGRDLTYIRYGLSTSVDDVWSQSARANDGGGPAPASPYALEDPRELHRALADITVGLPQRPTWLMPRLFGTALRLDYCNGVLYEGGGLLLYLAHARAGDHAADGQPSAAQVLGTALPQGRAASEAPAAASPFTGSLSNRVTAIELGAAGPAAKPSVPEVEVDTSAFTGADALSAEDLDYLNGIGGYLVYLSEYGDPAGPRLDGLPAEDIVARLVEVDGSPDEHVGDLGLAHGRFGRMAALSAGVAAGADPSGRARRHLERFSDAYLRHRWQDEALADAARESGWCKGYAGVAFAATKVLTTLGHTAAQTREAIAPEVERVVEGALNGDISLCHGLAGRVAMLCWLADRLEWPELRGRAKELNTRFLDRYADGGWVCGVGANVYLPSFLLGLSGWYFAQLMLEDPAVRLPLCLGGR